MTYSIQRWIILVRYNKYIIKRFILIAICIAPKHCETGFTAKRATVLSPKNIFHDPGSFSFFLIWGHGRSLVNLAKAFWKRTATLWCMVQVVLVFCVQPSNVALWYSFSRISILYTSSVKVLECNKAGLHVNFIKYYKIYHAKTPLLCWLWKTAKVKEQAKASWAGIWKRLAYMLTKFQYITWLFSYIIKW